MSTPREQLIGAAQQVNSDADNVIEVWQDQELPIGGSRAGRARQVLGSMVAVVLVCLVTWPSLAPAEAVPRPAPAGAPAAPGDEYWAAGFSFQIARRSRGSFQSGQSDRCRRPGGAQPRFAPAVPWIGQPAAGLLEGRGGRVVQETHSPVVERVLLQAVDQLVELRAGCARVNPGCAAVYIRAVEQDAARFDPPLQLDLAAAEGCAAQERQAEAIALV
jgi:hypothetical protein